MRILWHANAPWCATGYGQQTALFTPRLRDLGHEVVISAFYGLNGQASIWNGIQVLPAGIDGYGNDIIGAHTAQVRPDLLICLADAWPMHTSVWRQLPAAMWMPVDCDVLGAADEKFLRETSRPPVAMSQHGYQALTDAGFDALYVPHGVDVSVFQPPQDRAALRKQWGVQDRFVIGINGANKDGVRKSYPEQFRAFAAFRRTHPEAVLLVHALPQFPNNQIDLGVLAARLGITDAVRFTDQYAYVSGAISAPQLASWYGALDVLSCCSYGEGFGVPIIEAQACGTPVIVTDGSAMSELAGPGWKVRSEPFWNPVHQAWWDRPLIGEITKAYAKAHRYAASKRALSREFALGYDADAVLLDYWKPALEVLAGKFPKAPPPPPVTGVSPVAVAAAEAAAAA